MSSLRYRLTLGPVMLALLLGVLWLDGFVEGVARPRWWPISLDQSAQMGPGVVLLVVGFVVCPLAAMELAWIFRAGGIKASRSVLSVAACLGLIVSVVVPAATGAVESIAWVGTAAAGVLVGALVAHAKRQTPKGATAAAGSALFSFVYLGILFGFFLAIRREHSEWVVLSVLVVTKACDIGAFFTGKAIGRHKLIPWLSPGKTWEGLVGGLVTSGAVAAGLYAMGGQAGRADIGLGLIGVVVGGAVIGGVGQLGDLMASLLKRDAGFKDSGWALPGFGGVLDVVDSVLLVGPVAFWFLHAR